MIAENLERVRKQIHEAALRAGRDPSDIQLVAVSKKKSLKSIAEARQCGQFCFGENYLQEAVPKIEQSANDIRWHFIGHLQSNKAKKAVRYFQVIETVDRLKIARLLEKHAAEMNKTVNIYIQVNIGREPQKSGIAPEKTRQLLEEIKPFSHLRVLGLMCTPPSSDHAEGSRTWFKKLHRLSVQLGGQGLFSDDNRIGLSMGMSGDFTVAVEEGATLVRVGTKIFGSRG
jgi:pyridoxal phosphate enzyme (YggS family)